MMEIKISRKRYDSLSKGKKALVITIAFLVFIVNSVSEWLRTRDWKKIGDNIGVYLLGVTSVFGVWGLWSYINVISNNISSPWLISKYNLFVVLSEIFAK